MFMCCTKLPSVINLIYSGQLLLSYTTNTRLSWKGLPGTDALAYYKNV